MQRSNMMSLNALRVFLVASRHLSIKQAAEELSVTPGAVSHQIKTLEQSLGRQLFLRRNNAIELTDAGEQLASQATPGLHMLSTALEQVARDGNSLRVRASMSFAVRWLIPRLHLFKAKHPHANVQVETFFDVDRNAPVSADVTIAYYRVDERPPDARILFEDMCRPYLAPSLLQTLSDPMDVATIPALQCAHDNWDWNLWLAASGMEGETLRYAEQFDMDDAALRAACAGMGMVLASEFMIEADLAEGRLVPLPSSPTVLTGCYALEINSLETGLSNRFVKWLRAVADVAR